MELLGYTIGIDYPLMPMNGKMVINTLNPHSYCVAKRDESFKIALQSSDILLPDGVGIVLAAKILLGRKIHKIAGYDIFTYLMRYLNESNGTCFFLGASEQTLERIKSRALIEYPNVTIDSYSPPYKSNFSNKDSDFMCKKINTLQPEVLFVGMTAPKQEKWVRDHKEKLNAQVMCSIGAVFDFYAGNIKRAPNWMIRYGLEWLHRSVISPKRLGIRNLTSNPEFLLDVFKYKFSNK